MTGDHFPAEQPPEGQFLLYQTEDGQTRIECRFAGESIWLSQALMAELFPEVRAWPERNLFFGGVHVVTRDTLGHFEAAGDPRRGGVARRV